MFIVKNRKIFIALSSFLVVASLVLLSVFGLKLGIDFKGGALTEVKYATRPSVEQLHPKLDALGIGEVLVQSTGENGYIVKTRELTQDERSALMEVLSEKNTSPITDTTYSSIGPSVGKELTRKAIILIILVSLMIVTFIAYAFRGVSQQIASWKYGVIAIVTLLHDVIIPVGIFTVLSHFYGAEVDTLFVVAILTVLGLSVSDTIVVFDRIRENLHSEHAEKKDVSFADVVGKSLSQVYTRSINTSLTIIVVLLALFFFGPESTRYFALMLTAGMFFGTYSSIFLASPLLVTWEQYTQKKALAAEKK
jgi:preprotein translocase subunit SecF